MGDVEQRWRIVYARDEPARHFDQRQELEAWEATVLASGLAGAPAGGRPKLVFALPLPVGMDADAERFDLGLVERRTSAEVRSALEPHVPVGHRLIDLHDVWVGAPAISGRVVAADYRLCIGPGAPADLGPAVAGMLSAPTIPRVRRRGERETAYDLRPLIGTVVVEPAGAGEGDGAIVLARLVVSPSEGTGRPDELIAAIADACGRPLRMMAGRRERIWLADEHVEDQPLVT